MKKDHRDRTAFIDHLEKKYSQKVQLHNFRRKQQQYLKRSLRAIRNRPIDDMLEYEASEMRLDKLRKLAY